MKGYTETMITIHFDPCDGHSPELSLTCHRYNVADEIDHIMRWGGKITRISAKFT